MRNVQDTTTLTSERQLVLHLYQQGRSVREIADTLHISTQRVYQQLKKLGVDSPSKKEAT